MRVVSVNVNGIKKAANLGLFDWLANQSADVICLQDTRITNQEIEVPEFQLPGFNLFSCDSFEPEKGGVAIYSRLQPKAIIFGLGFPEADHYGRYLQLDFDKISISSLLFPTGQESEKQLDEKFSFMENFTEYLIKQRRKRREYIYCASLYIAYQKLDVKNWRECQALPGFLTDERIWLDDVFADLGYVDAMRELTRETNLFTWWPESEQAEVLNMGWRFDYQLLTPGLRRIVRDFNLSRQPRFSQHAPLTIDYNWTLEI
ncbi:exodeoxyribonuclease III [Gammaproteobacteria bacterium ESL0073]|nr:exodeoxyribonuclease III [Gammaproteobacteria bacterium ESL0073]